MEDAYRYEAAVLGDDLAALFAGYLLKRNRIRFLFLDVGDLNLERLRLKGEFPYEVSAEDKKLVDEIYRKLSAQVGISDKILFSTDAEKTRLETFLRSELEEEVRNRALVTDVIYTMDEQKEADSQIFKMEEDDVAILKCGDRTIEIDAVIDQQDVLTAGICAQAVFEEKQRRLEESMRRLRIKSGKRNPRKMVYVTHSKSWFYAREVVMQFAVKQGAAAVNPFMNYGFYLDGAVKKDEVMECCHQIIRTADELWVFGPVSEEILTDIAVAVMEGKEVRFFSISEFVSEIHELKMEDIIFEREVHAGQIRKSDLLNFVQSTAPKGPKYIQMSLFD